MANQIDDIIYQQASMFERPASCSLSQAIIVNIISEVQRLVPDASFIEILEYITPAEGAHANDTAFAAHAHEQLERLKAHLVASQSVCSSPSGHTTGLSSVKLHAY